MFFVIVTKHGIWYLFFMGIGVEMGTCSAFFFSCISADRSDNYHCSRSWIVSFMLFSISKFSLFPSDIPPSLFDLPSSC